MKYSRITHAPLPKLSSIIRATFLDVPSTVNLSRPWEEPNDVSYWFSRSSWSMYIAALWRQKLKKQSLITVWLPEYFCNGSLSLLREAGAQFVFYPNDSEGNPDVENFPVVTKDNYPDLFLLVHYFGKPTQCDDALEFCHSYGSWIIEDAAHVLKPTTNIGKVGDIVLYSPHKHLPISDGAIMVVRNEGPSKLTLRPDDLLLLDELVTETLASKKGISSDTVLWVMKRILQGIGIRSLSQLPAFTQSYEESEEIKDPPRMTKLAKKMLGWELSQLSQHASHRIQCEAEWARVIHEVFPVEGYRVALANDAPYLACVTATDEHSAEYLYKRLHQVGVPATTWPDLPPEVINQLNKKASHWLRHTRIFVPVHRSVTAGQIADCGDRLRDADLAGWRLREIKDDEEWNELWTRCERKTLPQTWEYGQAKALAENWHVYRYVVSNENEIPISLFQVLVKGFKGLGGIARINRGPLIIDEQLGERESLTLRSIEVIAREARRRHWWMMQMAPLLEPSTLSDDQLKALRFKKQPICPSDSALVSLSASDEELLKGLNGKWRNCLRKGQKLGVTVIRDEGGSDSLQWLLEFYRDQQVQKGFEGTSDAMLGALVACQSDSFKFNLYFGFEGDSRSKEDLLGVLVTLQYGDYCEYLIGATNDKGRNSQANSVLLWEALLDAKRKKCLWFDVGGLAENTPKGIAKFKRGLNPEPYTLTGEWRKWF